jgi:hypothetical protein
MTRDQVLKLVTVLRAAFTQGEKMSDATARIYEQRLADLEFEPTMRAVDRLIDTRVFLPAISEIRQATLAVSQGPAPDAIEAYGTVSDAVRHVGRYELPRFRDPITASVVRDFGWATICDSTHEESLRARFLEAYRERAARQQTEMSLPESLRLSPAPSEPDIDPRLLRARQEIAGTWQPPKPRELPARPAVRHLAAVPSQSPPPPPAPRTIQRIPEPETQADLEARRIDALARLAAFDQAEGT